MIKLILKPPHIEIRGADLKAIRAVDQCTSYLVSGYFFSPAFKHRRWDGREHLIKFQRGRYLAPVGLLGDIIDKLKEMGLDYRVKRSKKPIDLRWPITLHWNPLVQLRDYQRAAISAMTETGPTRGCGILKMPIRSGKTKTGAGVIYHFQTRTLFLVPSQTLLHQTYDSLKECFPRADIGKIGDNEFNEGRDITVCTLQSLVAIRGGSMRTCRGNPIRNDSGIKVAGAYADKACICGKKRCDGGKRYKLPAKQEWAGIRDGYGLLIIDEAHHLVGEAWHGAVMELRARYRLGLSATVFFDLAKEVERGVIWLKACCGQIKHEVSTTDLIERGFLMRQHVKVYLIDRPDQTEEEWSGELRNKCIYENVYRNSIIVALARRYVERGLTIMIVTNRLNQIKRLTELLDRVQLKHTVVTGREKGPERARRIKLFRSGSVPVIVGTIFGEGLDVPEVEVLINAEGGHDVKATVQRMRNLTPHAGKTKAILVDFFDKTNKHFSRHSRARLKTYASEPAFRIRRLWLPKSKDKRA